MNHQQHVLAQKKQLLRYRSAQQRRQLAQDAVALVPAFIAAEYVRNGIRWVRENPAIVAATLTSIVVARPQAIFRWTRRGWLAWLVWRKWDAKDKKGLDSANPLIERISALFS